MHDNENELGHDFFQLCKHHQLVYYILDKHEDKYFGIVCTLHFLDGNKICVIFGLFIIG